MLIHLKFAQYFSSFSLCPAQGQDQSQKFFRQAAKRTFDWLDVFPCMVHSLELLCGQVHWDAADEFNLKHLS